MSVSHSPSTSETMPASHSFRLTIPRHFLAEKNLTQRRDQASSVRFILCTVKCVETPPLPGQTSPLELFTFYPVRKLRWILGLTNHHQGAETNLTRLTSFDKMIGSIMSDSVHFVVPPLRIRFGVTTICIQWPTS